MASAGLRHSREFVERTNCYEIGTGETSTVPGFPALATEPILSKGANAIPNDRRLDKLGVASNSPSWGRPLPNVPARRSQDAHDASRSMRQTPMDAFSRMRSYHSHCEATRGFGSTGVIATLSCVLLRKPLECEAQMLYLRWLILLIIHVVLYFKRSYRFQDPDQRD
jgi:hypothetical protein